MSVPTRPDFPIRIAIPKGSLQENAITVLRKARLPLIEAIPERQYKKLSRQPEFYEFRLVRPEQALQGINSGDIDIAIVGQDAMTEYEIAMYAQNRLRVEMFEDFLEFSKNSFRTATWKLAVPVDSEVDDADQFLEWALQRERDGGTLMITSELPLMTRRYLWLRFNNTKPFTVRRNSGAAESNVGWGFDAAIDLSESGDTFRMNDLKPIDDVFTTGAILVGDKNRLEVEKLSQRSNVIEQLRLSILCAAYQLGGKEVYGGLLLDEGRNLA
jgi:ATP phosphoribosyltransferase